MTTRLFRGQVSAEYAITASAIVVIVAVVMVPGFKNLEMDVALSATRLAGVDFATGHPYYKIGKIDYLSVDDDKVVHLFPYYYAYYGMPTSVPGSEISQQQLARDLSVRQLHAVFAPNASTTYNISCQNATYRAYCVWPNMTLPP